MVAAPTRPSGGPLAVLVVDDEIPAREELTYLLGRDPRVGTVRTADSGAHALDLLAGAGGGSRAGDEGDDPRLHPPDRFDVVFCDIKMPGLDGLQLAKVLGQFADPPQIVFVSAYDDHAVDAFDLGATDYVMKPFRAERLAEAVRRVVTYGHPAPTDERTRDDDGDETIPVELAGITTFVRRSQVRYVEAQGDYARLWTVTGNHLVRVPLTTLEQRWSDAGFARIHRSTLVALHHVEEFRMVDGHCTVRVGADELNVSRRHVRELRDRLALRGPTGVT